MREFRLYLVYGDSFLQVFVAFGVLVVGPDKDALLPCGHGKRSNARHGVGHHLAGLEVLDHPSVLGLQLAVPVDLCIVQLEGAVVLTDYDIEVVGSSENLVREGTEFGRVADISRLVDDGADGRVLVAENLSNNLLVGEELVTEVKVGWTMYGI